MFQQDPTQRPMGIFQFMLPPHFIGGVVQSSEPSGARHNPEISRLLWGLVSQAARRLAGAVWHPQHGRLEIGHLGSEMK